MRTILVAAAAALMMGGSIAHAAFLLGEDENGHKQVVNTDAPPRIETYAARIAEPAPQRVSPAYAGETVATHAAGVEAPTPQAVDRGFLLGEDDNGGKRVINEYAQ